MAGPAPHSGRRSVRAAWASLPDLMNWPCTEPYSTVASLFRADEDPVGRAAGFDLCAADGVRLRAEHWPIEPPGSGAVVRDETLAVVVAHGFTGGAAKPKVRAVVEHLVRHAGVYVFDFRGHGASGGESTVGDEEILDLDAVVAAARAVGYARVVTLGFSMGGAVAIRHAALIGVRTFAPVDAVAAVSAVSRWYRTETPPMRRLHWAIQTAPGRAFARRALGTRIAAAGWSPPPMPPDALVGRISPVPLLLVHGDRDPYLTMDNAEDLYAAAREPVTLWTWPGFAHAESGMTPDRTARLGTVLVSMARGNRAEEWAA